MVLGLKVVLDPMADIMASRDNLIDSFILYAGTKK